MEDGEEMREMDEDFNDDEQSLSRSMSQMTTRGETTQPDEDTPNLEVSNFYEIHKIEIYFKITCKKNF